MSILRKRHLIMSKFGNYSAFYEAPRAFHNWISRDCQPWRTEELDRCNSCCIAEVKEWRGSIRGNYHFRADRGVSLLPCLYWWGAIRLLVFPKNEAHRIEKLFVSWTLAGSPLSSAFSYWSIQLRWQCSVRDGLGRSAHRPTLPVSHAQMLVQSCGTGTSYLSWGLSTRQWSSSWYLGLRIGNLWSLRWYAFRVVWANGSCCLSVSSLWRRGWRCCSSGRARCRWSARS